MQPTLLACALALLPFLHATAPAQQPVPKACSSDLWFEPMPAGDAFHARGSAGASYRIESDGLVARAGIDEVTLRIVEPREDAVLEPLQQLRGVSNYYFGNDEANWRSGVPHFARLVARSVRPGIDLVWRSAGRELEFDVVAQPGADLQGLRLRAGGVRGRMRLHADGSVVLPLVRGALHLHPPVVYQERAGVRTQVACRYLVEGDEILFDVGDHDRSVELTIDPVVTFATLLGGNGNDTGIACAVDNQGFMVVTGTTTSTDFPLLNQLPMTVLGVNAYVTRFDPQGNLVFSTLFGGTGNGSVTPVDVGCDPQGWVVFGGNTNSSTLPVTQGVVQPTPGSWFFAALLPSGVLSWCTYYNGGNMKALHVLDVLRGSVIGVGVGSPPLMPGGYSNSGGISVVGIHGGNVLWCSTQCGFGGTPTAIHVTQHGHICITGTIGTGLPTTAGSFQQTPRGNLDGFVFVFFGTANSLVFCSYFGGTLNDTPRRIRAVSGPGTVHCTIAGETGSADLPLQNAIQNTRRGNADCFVARLNGNMSGLDFSTYLGSSGGTEVIMGLELDAQGNTIFGGWTNWLDFPYLNPLRYPVSGMNADGFVAKLRPDGGALVWATQLGGNNNDFMSDLALGPAGEIVVTGNSGPPFPTTTNALPTPVPAGNDAFLVQLADETFTSYGSGTPGFWGWVPALCGGRSAQVGTTAMFNVHDGRAQAFGLMALGFGRSQVPFFNGFLWTLPVATAPVQLRGTAGNTILERGGGYLHWPLAIPANPNLVNTVANLQAFFLDAAGFGGVTMTNGVEMVVR